MPIYRKYWLMSETATLVSGLRDLHGAHAAKQIARRVGIAVITAKVWLSGKLPISRHLDVALLLDEQLDLLDRRNAEYRRAIREIVENAGTEEIESARARIGARAARAAMALDRVEAHAEAAKELLK